MTTLAGTEKIRNELYIIVINFTKMDIQVLENVL